MELPDVANGMTRKLGPLPVWAWVTIPAGAYVAWSYYRASQEPEPTVDSVGGSAGTDSEDYGVNTGGSYLPSYGAAPDGTSNLPPVNTTPAQTNATWSRQAINWLIEEGFSSTDAVTALNAYLYGTPDTITATQGNALQRAIARFGPAPDPAFIPTITPASDSALEKAKKALADALKKQQGTEAARAEQANRAAALQKLQALEVKTVQLRQQYMDARYSMSWRLATDAVITDIRKAIASNKSAAWYNTQYAALLTRYNKQNATKPRKL